MARFQIWYLKPEHLRTTLQGPNGLDPKRLKRTHTHLMDLDNEPEGEIFQQLETIFCGMQAENWSPNGEARSLIIAKSLDHTSMSVDDIIVDEAGRVFIVDALGFRELIS